MLKAYKYRLYPSKDQEEILSKHFGHTRHIFNWGLEEKKKHYQKEAKNLSRFDLQKIMVLSKKEDKPWLKEVNSQSLLASLGHLDEAFTNFFKKRARFPKFKSKRDRNQSFQCPQHVEVDQEKGILHLPKIKNIQAIFHRSFEGSIKTCTISKNACNEYFVSILVENNQALPLLFPKSSISKENTIGVDLGIKDFIVTSNGEKKDNMRFLSSSLEELKEKQQILSRSKKGSSNRDKKRIRVAKTHLKVSRQREWYHHEIANKLLSDSQVWNIAFEDLHVKGMIRNKRLSRHIADVSWSRFVSIVSYKAMWQGKRVLFCNRFAASSKTCSCGYVYQELTLGEREWTCASCNIHHDRDILAARNVQEFAIADAVGQTVCVKKFPSQDRLSKSLKANGQRINPQVGRKKLNL